MSVMDLVNALAPVAPFAGPTTSLAMATRSALTSRQKEISARAKKEVAEALAPEPEQAPSDPSLQHVSGVGAAARSPTQQQFIALTAVAASQPANLPKFMKSAGIKLTAADLARLKAATAHARKIMAHPNYKHAKINLTAVRGWDSGNNPILGADVVGFSFGNLLKRVVTAPLAALALPAAALTWGASKIVKAPLALIQYGARKGGWKTPGVNYHAPAAPASTAAPNAWGTVPSQYIPPPPSGAPGAPPDMSAYYARMQAAQVQSDQAQQQLAAQQQASDAEASALDAEAQAQADQQAAMQAQYGIAPGDGDDQMGASIADATLGELDVTGFSLNPLKAVGKLSRLASGAISTVAHVYQHYTPADLQKVMRWTPQGLVFRAGVKIAPATKRALGQAVKWSPGGMLYRGAKLALPKLAAPVLGAWVRRPGQARPTLVVGDRVVSFDASGRATIH